METPTPPTGFHKGLTSYGDAGFSYFLRTAFIKGGGFSNDALARPVIGLINTGSGYNPCHGNAPALLEAAKRGIMLAGGLPVEFPTISIHESFAHPTSMFLRNLMAMDTEETKMRVERNVEGENLLVELVMEERRRRRRKTRSVQRTMATTK